MSNDYVTIEGLSRSTVLAALFNNSKPVGMGLIQAHIQGNHDMDEDEAYALVHRTQMADNDFGFNVRTDDDGHVEYFDYVRGRPLKLRFSGETVYVHGYDQDNGGPGTAERIINGLRGD